MLVLVFCLVGITEVGPGLWWGLLAPACFIPKLDVAAGGIVGVFIAVFWHWTCRLCACVCVRVPGPFRTCWTPVSTRKRRRRRLCLGYRAIMGTVR